MGESMSEQGHHAATLRQLLQLIDAEPDRFMEAVLDAAIVAVRDEEVADEW